VGQLFPGDPGITRGIIPVRWHHFSPRIGLAWDPFGDGKTSIRAAAGIFYGSLSGNNWNQPSNAQPFATRLTFTNTGSGRLGTGGRLSDPYRGLAGGNPFPYQGAYNDGGSIQGIATDFQWPYTYQLNLSVQRQITRDLSITTAYVGTLSHNLPFAPDVNYPQITPTASTGNVQQRRPNQGFGPVLLVLSNQSASYHGLQLSVAKKMARHFLLNASYTYSKNFNSVQLDNNTLQGGAQNMADLRQERGRADIDQRHAFSASAVWQIDYSYANQSVLRALLNGWSISPIVKLHSGLPFTVLNGLDANLDGTSNTDRARLIGDPRLANSSPQMWFNIFAFRQNPVTNGNPVDGNSPRNFLDRPGFRTVDLAIFRGFKFLEHYNMEFRAEGSNVFNMVSLRAPNSTIPTTCIPTACGNFGQITTAESMRQLQLGLRLIF
jgi:hypothetical protein